MGQGPDPEDITDAQAMALDSIPERLRERPGVGPLSEQVRLEAVAAPRYASTNRLGIALRKILGVVEFRRQSSPKDS